MQGLLLHCFQLRAQGLGYKVRGSGDNVEGSKAMSWSGTWQELQARIAVAVAGNC